MGKGADYLYHGRNQFIGVHTHDYLQISTRKKNALVTRYPSEIFPEYILIRVNEFNQEAVSLLEEWMSYLKDGNRTFHRRDGGVVSFLQSVKLESETY